MTLGLTLCIERGLDRKALFPYSTWFMDTSEFINNAEPVQPKLVGSLVATSVF